MIVGVLVIVTKNSGRGSRVRLHWWGREGDRQTDINIYTFIHATALFLGFCFQSLSASCEVTTMGSSCLTAFVSRL